MNTPSHSTPSPRRRRRPTPWMLRRQVALQCFDATCPEVAVARLARWINSDPQLHDALVSVGYRPRLRRFSPNMVRILRCYLL